MLKKSEMSIFVAVVVVFALIAHPKTYMKVHKLSKMIRGPSIVTPYGVSTTIGLLAHAIVAAGLAIIILRFM